MKNIKGKNTILKKCVKWFVGIFLFLLIVLISVPYLFKDKIKELITVAINNNIEAVVSFDDVDISFLKKFPESYLTLNNLALINKAPFKGDTLFYAKELNLQLKITELFKGSDEPKRIESFSVQNGLVSILFNNEGKANYDIAVKKDSIDISKEKSKPFSLDIKTYTIANLDLRYYDVSSDIKMHLKNINHTGKGVFKESTIDLDTKTESKLSLKMSGVNYMNNLSVSLNAILGIDINNYKLTFKENSALINQLPLKFNGSMQFVGKEMNQSYNINFFTPTSTFKNLLGVIPAQYSGNIENVKTEGNFDVKGNIVGLLSENSIPTFQIDFFANNAMFQYPELPKSVKNINVNSSIINKTGKTNDTYISLNNLQFSIDKDVFKMNASVYNFIENPRINLFTSGIINLNNVSKAYPISIEQPLNGILNANISTSFDMNSVEKKLYKNIKNSGSISLENFVYRGSSLTNPLEIKKTSVTFSNNTIALKEFKAKTGETDVNIDGNLNNFYGFLFNKEVLKGSFILNSNTLSIGDFITEIKEPEEKTSKSAALKIPDFLDCTFIATAKKVIYDNLEFTNASGTMVVKNQTVSLQNFNMNAFEGLLKMNGNVSTKDSIATFAMNLNLENVDIKQSFGQIKTIQSIAPVADVIGGKINTKLSIKGNLQDDMTADISSISGDLLGQLLKTKLNASNSKVLSYVGNETGFFDAEKLNLENLKTQLTFKEGKVVVKPFQIKYNDINIEIDGERGFDQNMNYNLTFNVPAKYLGKEVNDLISKLSNKEQENLSLIPVKANLTGNFSNPKIKTDVKQASNLFMKQLVDQQKNNFLNKGKEGVLDLLGKKKDTSKAKKTDVLKGLFKKKKNNK